MESAHLTELGHISGAKQLGYPVGFAILAVPAFLGLIVLLVLQRIYLNPRDFEAGSLEIKGEGAGDV